MAAPKAKRSRLRRSRATWRRPDLVPATATAVLGAYASGVRDFRYRLLDGESFANANIADASFLGSSLRGADFSNANMNGVQLKSATATDARFLNANLGSTDLIAADFRNAVLKNVDLTGASLFAADLRGADLSDANINNARLGGAKLAGAQVANAKLHTADLSDLDASTFCAERTLRHGSPSTLDWRTVVHTLHHPHLKAFMLDCGVPDVFAEFMIDCARSMDNQMLRILMQSTFISYGGPDEAFARRFYVALKAHGVVTYFFPETASVGERIDNEVFRRIQEHDRILLICSRNSLDRPGVVNEIQETLDREARDGGASYLLPITLDNYILTDWKKRQPVLAERIGRRVIADFSGALRSKVKFEAALARVLSVLKKKRP